MLKDQGHLYNRATALSMQFLRNKMLHNLLWGVDDSLQLPLPSMNRLNQTSLQHFQLCRVGLSLGILFYSILLSNGVADIGIKMR
jgi:hypothetical protein